MTIQTSFTLQPVPGALEAAKRDYLASNPKSRAAYENAANVLPGGGTRATLYVDPFPLYISGGKGTSVTDLDGHEYRDFCGDFVSGLFGKTNPILRAAIIDALDHGVQLGMHTTNEAKFASLIRERLPSMELIRFANSGTEACLQAISLAMRYTSRQKVAVFAHGYHGSMMAGFGEASNSTLCAPFDWVVCPYNDLEGTRMEIKKYEKEIACVIVEPMQGSGGCIPGKVDFLKGLRQITEETGALLIFDEIQTARLDYNGLQGKLKMRPDLTTIGKYFGGGLHFGAFGGRRDIMELLDPSLPNGIKVGGTFNNCAMTMTAGIAALTHLMTRENLDRVNDLGDRLRDGANDLFKRHHAPFSVSGYGSINEIHPTVTGPRGKELAQLLFFALLHRGIAIAQRGLIALTIEAKTEDVGLFLQVLEDIVISEELFRRA